jgi:hypothetical protein
LIEREGPGEQLRTNLSKELQKEEVCKDQIRRKDSLQLRIKIELVKDLEVPVEIKKAN